MKKELDRTSTARAGAEIIVSRFFTRLNQYMRTGKQNPAWFAMFTLGRFVIFRNLASRIRSSHRPSILNNNTTSFPNLSCEAIASSVRDEGVCLGINLPSDVIEQVLSFAESNACFANSDKTKPILVSRKGMFARTGETVVIGDYHDQIFNCRAIRALCTDGMLMRIAEEYLDARPQLTRSRLWWSFIAPQASQQEYYTFSQGAFHFDIDDWKCVKFFFYLTEVDEQAGPHRFIRHSHRRRKLRHQFTLFKGQSLKSLEKVYPPEAFLTITGPAGFGFAEDPFGFHTGTSVQARPRLMLEVEYGVTRLPVAGRYAAPLS
jgi:hypothetical protein